MNLFKKHTIAVSIFLILFTVTTVPSTAKKTTPKDLSNPAFLKKTHKSLRGLSSKVTLDLRNIDVLDFLKFVAIKGGLNIVTSSKVQGKLTLFLKEITIGNALKLAMELNNLAFEVDNEGVIKIISSAEYELRYGIKFNDKREINIINFKNLTNQDISTVLTEIKSSNGKVIINNATKTIVVIDHADKFIEMEKIIESMERPVITKSFELANGDMTKVVAEITKELTADIGRINTNDRTKSIIISDYPEKIKRIDNIIEKFDKRSKEVLIQAKIVQIRLNDSSQMGINWQNLLKSTHNLNITGNFSLVPAISTGQKISIGSSPDDDFTAVLDMLKSYGETNIISSPHITVMDGQEASIHVGTSEPYTTGSTNSTSVSSVVSDNVEFIDVGVKLVVTPTISKDGFVTMVIKPEISDKVDTFISPSGQSSVPVVKKTEASTVVSVRDGVTIIIGGLIEDKRSESSTTVPFFGKIPILGNLFRSSITESIKTELVTLITPHIISGMKDTVSAANLKQRKPKRDIKIKKRKPKRS